MPLYEFVCQECKQSFEQLVRSLTLAPIATCPHCGSSDTQKKLSVFATKASNSGGGIDYAANACAPGGT
ncbi:MAG: hypothetical protein B6D41_07470 [Chloroflexi bacterium UTCFX4]|jgi:putative FmdB family regulatory protein|nr:MAG: hypothetical protein B6D41_07470 [Chloroflexi bacterium UTCFX4]